MKFPYRIEREDYDEHVQATSRRSGDWTRPLRFSGYVAFSAGLLCHFADIPHESLLAPLALMVMGLALLVSPIWMAYREIDRSWSDVRTSSDDALVDVTPDGIGWSAPEWRSWSQWSQFTEVVETRRLFILFRRGSRECWAIPKRCFDSPADVQEFRQLAAAHVQGAAKGFPVLPAGAPPVLTPDHCDNARNTANED